VATRNHQGFWFDVGAGVGMVHTLILGFANPCSMGALGSVGLRGLNGLQAVGGAFNLVENVQNGNYLMAALDGLGILGNVGQMFRACFRGETPILMLDGEKRADAVRKGDRLLARSEFDPEGPLEAKQVEEVFIRMARVLNLHAGGRVIGTTAEHPFWVQAKGWQSACDLQPGDRLSSHDGQWIVVEAVTDSGEVTTVYNFRVAEYHTYFVGSSDWGFSVWAHNAENYATAAEEAAALRARSKLGARVTEAIPLDQPIRTAKEYAQTSDFYRNNKPLARRLWEERTGRKWPVDENGVPFTGDHDVALGGRRGRADPLDITPGRGSAARTANGDRTPEEMRATGAMGTPAREFNRFSREWLESIRGNAD
jgi:hypothetical protein